MLKNQIKATKLNIFNEFCKFKHKKEEKTNKKQQV